MPRHARRADTFFRRQMLRHARCHAAMTRYANELRYYVSLITPAAMLMLLYLMPKMLDATPLLALMPPASLLSLLIRCAFTPMLRHI